MTPEQLEAYNRESWGHPRLRVSDLDDGDHTLTTGYNVNGEGNVHVYVMDGEIHLLVHDSNRVICHEHGNVLPAINLRPSKRAYPHTTNEKFARLMRNVGEPLTFLGRLDWSQDWVQVEMAMEPFKARTHLDF